MKSIAILGAGESGIGAALLSKKLGYNTFVSDSGLINEKNKAELNSRNILWEEGGHSINTILSADEVIKSPGIPDNTAIIKQIQEANIPIISEIEFAGRHTRAKMICITGSNGKTTTTLLIYHLFKKALLNVGLAGNVGTSLARQVAENNYDYYVIELSSFQLDNMYQFKADIAILLNITPDHLDRYDYKMENYIKSKFRIINNQTSEDAFIFCADDKNIQNALKEINHSAKVYPFSLVQKQEIGAYFAEENIHVLTLNNTFSMNKNEISIKGKHNIYNSMAAGITGLLSNIKSETIRESLQSFESIEHRLEYVASVKNIAFINDSKATNVNSTWYALECIQSPVVWIAGGIDKGNDYSELISVVKDRVHTLICLGKDNDKLKATFGEIIPLIVEVDNMESAVNHAYLLARKKDTVLLSPCCASFDLFKNYEDRGTQFKKMVRNL